MREHRCFFLKTDSGLLSFKICILLRLVLSIFGVLAAAKAQFVQQSPPLAGTGAVGTVELGFSVSLSADGNTLIVGGVGDNGGVGAAWVFTRSDGVWSQQGSQAGRYRARGTAGYQGYFGCAVRRRQHRHRRAGSDNEQSIGAAWVFTRSGGVWTQQGRSWSAPGAGRAGQGAPSRCPRTATPPSWAGSRQLGRRGGVGLHPQRRRLDPARPKLVGTGAVGAAPCKATPSRCPATAIRAIVGGWLPTTRAPGRRGCGPVAVASGPSKAASWSAPAP